MKNFWSLLNWRLKMLNLCIWSHCKVSRIHRIDWVISSLRNLNVPCYLWNLIDLWRSISLNLWWSYLGGFLNYNIILTKAFQSTWPKCGTWVLNFKWWKFACCTTHFIVALWAFKWFTDLGQKQLVLFGDLGVVFTVWWYADTYRVLWATQLI